MAAGINHGAAQTVEHIDDEIPLCFGGAFLSYRSHALGNRGRRVGNDVKDRAMAFGKGEHRGQRVGEDVGGHRYDDGAGCQYRLYFCRDSLDEPRFHGKNDDVGIAGCCHVAGRC